MIQPLSTDLEWRDPVIEAYKKDIDFTLLDENLKLTVDQRMQKFVRMREMYNELKLAGENLRAEQQRQRR